MQKDKKIAVIYGGPSSEAEVSTKTANAVLNSLTKQGFRAQKIEFSKTIAREIKDKSIDVVFNAMHGLYGEDGSLAGLLEVLKVPYTHSGVLASSLAMDKNLTKILLLTEGINSPQGKVLKRTDINSVNLNFPCVIKPVSEGSSVGVEIVRNKNELASLSLEIEEYLVEEFISGIELSVAVLDGEALGVIEIRPKSGIYDYISKYTTGASEYIFPAKISDSITKEAIKYAEIAHKKLKCRGVTRSDIIYNEEQNQLYFLEINTHPGMTENSLVPKIAAQQDINFDMLVEKILNSAKLELSQENG